MPQALIQIAAVTGSRKDLPINTLVQLNNLSIGGELTYAWTFVAVPPGSAVTYSDATIQNPTFTPDVEGTYLLRVVVNAATTPLANQAIVGVLDMKTGLRVPAYTETTEGNTEAGVTTGWDDAQGAWDRAVMDMLAAQGTRVGTASGAGLNPGDVVRVSSYDQIKIGLPGAEFVPGFTLALATAAYIEDAPLGVVLGLADGGGAAIAGELVRVRYAGLYPGLAGAPVVGDPVYVSDAGAIALVAGTNQRQIGVVAFVAGTWVLDIDGVGAGAGSGPGLTEAFLLNGPPVAVLPNAIDITNIIATLNFLQTVDAIGVTFTGSAGQTLDLTQWIDDFWGIICGVKPALGGFYTNGLEFTLNDDAAAGTGENTEIVAKAGDGAATLYEWRLGFDGVNGLVKLYVDTGDTILHIGEYDLVTANDNSIALGSGDGANESRAQFRFSGQVLELEDGGGALAFNSFIITVETDMSALKIVNMADPTAVQDAATKFYVDPQVLDVDADDSPVSALNRQYIHADTSAGGAAPIDIEVDLPAPVTGMRIHVMKADAGANVVNVNGFGGPLINGAATYVLNNQYDAVTVYSDGTNWFVE